MYKLAEVDSWCPPPWGSLVEHADYDLLAFAVLLQSGLLKASFYHAVQALEKYLKALVISIVAPTARTSSHPPHRKLLISHDLVGLAQVCGGVYPYYRQTDVQNALSKFAEFDQPTRYPWIEKALSNGFTTADIPLFSELFLRLRNDLPIVRDDYPLGMSIRGHHHNHPELPAPALLTTMLGPAVAAARSVIPQIEKLVRL
jgi:hypothetical protein